MNTQLSPPETQNNVNYIHNTIKITISLFLQEHEFIIYFTAKVVPLVQHIKMCTGSLRGGKATIATTLRGHQKYLNTPLK